MKAFRGAPALVLTAAMIAGLGLPIVGQQPAVRADDAAAIAQFETAVSNYMALRERLRNEIPGPVAESTAAQLTRASDMLAAAIQRSRSNARVGAIFVAPAAVVVKRRVTELVGHDGTVLTGIDDDPVTVTAPAIHLRFPAASQMATMPPSLLAVLPSLPTGLEYRIIGDYLILRDVDAALILDYIPAAVPRKR